LLATRVWGLARVLGPGGPPPPPPPPPTA
jgi:hypothetical protein